MARSLPMPVLTTLHTPPLWWLESAVQLDRGSSSFAAVSRHTAASWAPITDSTVVLNGVDVTSGPPVPAGRPPCGRAGIVAEKAPHHAVLAARRAGVPIVLAGPILDLDYFRERGRAAARRRGDVRRTPRPARARRPGGRAGVAVVTPAWDEPYGLVAAEALSCGTPVAAYARGGLPEVLTADTGRLAAAGDVDVLARAIREALPLDRARCREHAVASCRSTRMVDRYEDLYRQLVDRRLAA